MNLSNVALLLLAWQLLSGNMAQKSKTPPAGLTDLLSEDTRNMIDCVGKLSSKDCSREDKTGAILQMLSNPAVMNLANSLFTQTSAPQQQPAAQENVNSEGYRFETPSEETRQFFRPIDNIADAEIKHKLYWFYDNWYIK